MTNVLTIDDLITDKKHSTFFAEVVTGKAGGLHSGADISTSTNQVTGQVQKTIPAITQTVEDDFAARVAGMAFTRVGTFTSGATLTDMRQTLLWELSQGGDGREYGWTGSFSPSGKLVAAGSAPTPVSAGNWVDRTEARLRSDINIVTKTFSHVAQMKAAIQLGDEGKLVEWVSYYDGWVTFSGGARGGNIGVVVAAGSGVADDGSLFDTDSGLQVKTLFKNGYVTYYDFGAKCDLVSDDSTKVRSAHIYANTAGVPVVQPKSSLVYNSTVKIPIKTDCDLHLCEFKIPDGLSITTLFEIQPTTPMLTGIIIPTSNLYEGNTVVSDFSVYENSVISIKSSDIDIYRTDGSSVYKRDIVQHYTEGHISHPLIHTISNLTGLTVNYNEKTKLVFKAPALVIGSSSIYSFIYCNRNDTHVEASAIIRSVSSGIAITVYFSPEYVKNNSMSGVSINPASPYFTASSYGMSGSFNIKPVISDFSCANGWAALDGNVCRDTCAIRVSGARIGIHSQAYNFTAEDCIFAERGILITGRGILNVVNCKQTVVGNTSSFNNSLVDLREDYGGEWDGDINIINPQIDHGFIAITDAGSSVVRLNNFDYNFGRAIKSPRKITIKGGYIKLSGNPSAVSAFYVVDTFRYTTNQTLVTRTVPTRIVIDGFDAINSRGGPVTSVRPYRGPNNTLTGISGTANITVRSCFKSFINTDILPLTQLGRSLFSYGASSTFASYTHKEKYTFIDTKVDAIFVAPSSWSLDIYRCEVFDIDGFYNSNHSSAVVRLNGCIVYPGRISGNSGVRIYNSEVLSGGGASTTQLNALLAKTAGNSVEVGLTITGNTVTNIKDYTNTSFFQ